MAISFDLEDTNERTRKAIAGVKKIRQNLADSKEEAAKTFKKNTRQTWEPPVARRPPTNEAAIKMTEAAPRRLVTPLGVLHKGCLLYTSTTPRFTWSRLTSKQLSSFPASGFKTRAGA